VLAQQGDHFGGQVTVSWVNYSAAGPTGTPGMARLALQLTAAQREAAAKDGIPIVQDVPIDDGVQLVRLSWWIGPRTWRDRWPFRFRPRAERQLAPTPRLLYLRGRMNLPNLLTLLRIFFVPLLVAALVQDRMDFSVGGTHVQPRPSGPGNLPGRLGDGPA